MVCAMVCLSDDLIYSNILALFLVVFLCGSFGFGIPRFAHKPYGRHLSPSARVLRSNGQNLLLGYSAAPSTLLSI